MSLFFNSVISGIKLSVFNSRATLHMSNGGLDNNKTKLATTIVTNIAKEGLNSVGEKVKTYKRVMSRRALFSISVLYMLM